MGPIGRTVLWSLGAVVVILAAFVVVGLVAPELTVERFQYGGW